MTSTADNAVTTQPSLELIKEVEQTLFREARLLDNEQVEEWMAMLAEDIHYFMPGVENRYRSDSTDTSGDLGRMAFYDDDIAMIRTRVARLRTGTAWSEDPPTRYVHLITNIEVELTDQPDQYRVYSNFYSYRNRNERDEDVLVGRRADTWRRDANGKLLLAKRVITPSWSVLPSKNLNVFL